MVTNALAETQIQTQSQTQAEAQNETCCAAEDLARSLADDTSLLFSPPDVYLRINDLLNDDNASSDGFAQVIAHDPSLTARLLKLVNSSYYGLPSKVDTISRALTIVGLHELTNLVYSICAIKSFSKVSSDITNMNTFWRHGIYCGIAARELAIETKCINPERLFVGGLMHDIGSLAINRNYPEMAAQTIEASEGSEQALTHLERDEVGFDHALLGALMFESWHLPQATCRAIRFHHNPDDASEAAHEAGIIHLADALANASGTGSFSETIAAAVDCTSNVLAPFGIAADYDFSQLLETVDQKFIETVYLLVA